MCLRPVKVNVDGPPERVKTRMGITGQHTQFTYHKTIDAPCGYCWACLKNKENDLVGRCLAEASGSHWVHTLTLTYDDKRLRDPSQTSIIHKADLQDWLKRLRFDGWKIRYLAAGEFGKEKGRVHFHVTLFGLGPEIPASHYQQRVYYPQWDWGYTYSDPTCTAKSIRYIAKYLTKGKRKKTDTSPQSEWITSSKKPLLGGAYFYNLGKRQAAKRIAPRTLNYMPPGGNPNHRYSMYGVAQREYFDAMLAQWPEFATTKKTEWVENAFRRYTREVADKAFCNLSPEERAEIIQNQYREVIEEKPLTAAQKLARAWKEYDAKLKRSEDEENAEVTKRAEHRASLAKSVVPSNVTHEYEFSPAEPSD